MHTVSVAVHDETAKHRCGPVPRHAWTAVRAKGSPILQFYHPTAALIHHIIPFRHSSPQRSSKERGSTAITRRRRAVEQARSASVVPGRRSSPWPSRPPPRAWFRWSPRNLPASSIRLRRHRHPSPPPPPWPRDLPDLLHDASRTHSPPAPVFAAHPLLAHRLCEIWTVELLEYIGDGS